MKTLCVLTGLLLLNVPALAEIKIPKGVFLIDQYEDALKAAKEQKKPLAIVELDESRSGQGAEETAEESFKSVTGIAVVLFVSTMKEGVQRYDLAPPFVNAASDQGARYLPVVMLCAPSEDVVWKVMCPSNAKTSHKEFKAVLRKGVEEAKPAIAAYFGSKTPPPFVHPGDKPLVWPFLKGRGFTGPFVKVEKEKLYIKTPKGQIAEPIELKDLKPATVRYARMLASLAAPAVKLVPEKWTNNKGKEIEATFVKLTDGKVTFQLKDGKESALPLTDLSEASQKRAKELAAKAGK